MPVHSPYAKLLSQMPVREDVVTVLGSKSHYWVYGPENAAVTIVIAHGYRGEHHGLEPVVAQFENVRFISTDMPGFGMSTPLTEANHSIEGYARWLAAFMKALMVEDAVVLGHSFGSIIASYAIAHKLITPPKLILINPIAASALDGPSRTLTRATMRFYRLSLQLPERAGYWLLSNWVIIRTMSVTLAQTRDRVLRRWIHDQHHQYFGKFADRQTVVESFDASVSSNVSDFASDIEVPTLLIGAERDPITSVAALHALETQIAGSQLHVIPGVGHLIHYEVPRIAAEFMVDFLGATGPTGVRLVELHDGKPHGKAALGAVEKAS